MSKIEEIKEKLKPIFDENNIERSSIFGSVARGEDSPDSDVDILVEFNKEKSLFDLVRIKRKINKVLGREIDLLTYESIDKKIKSFILKDAIQIYG